MKKILTILLILISVNCHSQTKIYASSKLVNNSIDAAESNSKALQSLINKAGTGSTVILPNGSYYFTKADTIFNKSLKIQGSELTNLYFLNCSGLVFIPGKVIQKCEIKDVSIFYYGNRAGTAFNGIESQTVINISNVFVKNFGGYGICLTGDMASSGTNVSFSNIMQCEIAECGNGVYTQGGDANWINFYSCSFRDMDGYGAWDNSFLGCNFYSPMAHACAKGAFRADNGNNRTQFFAPYMEGGQPKSIIGGVTRVYGGICGPNTGWETNSNWCKIDQQ